MMEKFEQIPGYGMLYIENVLFEGAFPILFICINKKQHRFLCVCCRSNEMQRKWLVAPISNKTIIDLLSDKLPIRDAFLKDKGRRYTVIKRDMSSPIIVKDDSSDWDSKRSSELPARGEYIEADADEFCDELAFYNQEILREIIKSLRYTAVENKRINAIRVEFDKNAMTKNMYQIIGDMDKANSKGIYECVLRPISSPEIQTFHTFRINADNDSLMHSNIPFRKHSNSFNNVQVLKFHNKKWEVKPWQRKPALYWSQ